MQFKNVNLFIFGQTTTPFKKIFSVVIGVLYLIFELLIGSRNKFQKKLKTEYEVFEVVGVGDKAAKKILEDKFMVTPIRQDQVTHNYLQWFLILS